MAVTRETYDRALAGDRQSMSTLIAQLRPVVRSQVAYTLRPSAAARRRDASQDRDDLVHDVLVELLARDAAVLRSWDPSRGAKLETFVRVVAHRVVMGVLRSRVRSPYALELIDKIDDFAGRDSDLDARLDARMRLLEINAAQNERGRRLFRALVIEERGPGPTASLLGMTRGAVRSWMYELRRSVGASPGRGWGARR